MGRLLVKDDTDEGQPTMLHPRELYPHEKEPSVHLRLEEELWGFGFIAVHETYGPGELCRQTVAASDIDGYGFTSNIYLGDLVSRPGLWERKVVAPSCTTPPLSSGRSGCSP
jgi:hypothetical protein